MRCVYILRLVNLTLFTFYPKQIMDNTASSFSGRVHTFPCCGQEKETGNTFVQNFPESTQSTPELGWPWRAEIGCRTHSQGP